MKRVIIFAVAMMLFTGSAFAAGAQEQPRGTQRNVTNITTADDTVVLNAGERNKTDIGVVSNKGGKQKNVTNMTKLNDTTVITSGQGNEARIGTVGNQ